MEGSLKYKAAHINLHKAHFDYEMLVFWGQTFAAPYRLATQRSVTLRSIKRA